MPIEQVADLFGHVDTRMVEHYRHQIKPAVDAAVAPMEALFGWPPETDGDAGESDQQNPDP